MESVVENNNFRNILAEDLAAGTDALNVSGVVQGSEIAQALDAGDNMVYLVVSAVTGNAKELR